MFLCIGLRVHGLHESNNYLKMNISVFVWTAPKASHLKASHPHFLHFLRLRHAAAFSEFSVFSAYSVRRPSQTPIFYV